MNKAFIFDMDGVLIDSERLWENNSESFFKDVFGKDIIDKIGSTLGMTVDMIYDKAVSFGFSKDRNYLYKRFDDQALKIYAIAPITTDIEKLGHLLITKNFKLGLVSASRKLWIDTVLTKISFSNSFDYIISINDRKDLLPKPHPAGYLEAIHKLHASPQTTLILEDSNTGIAAGKAAGATVIGFRANLLPGYKQDGADYYAENIENVIEIVKKFTL